MKFTIEIIINLPVQRVTELFDNPDNLKHWMTGLESFEHISGSPGEPGAKSKLIFNHSGRKMVMIETITEKNLPENFAGTYETKGMLSINKNSFVAIAADKTKLISEQDFQLSGMYKLLGWLFPGSFKKQSLKFLTAFKEFAEKS